MNELLPHLIWFAGIGQAGVLIASALVPFHLKWKLNFESLPKLHRQLFWVYGGYIVLTIVAFSLISLTNSIELANGSGLARGLCGYIGVFWGIRLGLQGVFDVKIYLTSCWLKVGYHSLTVLFLAFTIIFTYGAFQPPR